MRGRSLARVGRPHCTATRAAAHPGSDGSGAPAVTAAAIPSMVSRARKMAARNGGGGGGGARSTKLGVAGDIKMHTPAWMADLTAAANQLNFALARGTHTAAAPPAGHSLRARARANGAPAPPAGREGEGSGGGAERRVGRSIVGGGTVGRARLRQPTRVGRVSAGGSDPCLASRRGAPFLRLAGRPPRARPRRHGHMHIVRGGLQGGGGGRCACGHVVRRAPAPLAMLLLRAARGGRPRGTLQAPPRPALHQARNTRVETGTHTAQGEEWRAAAAPRGLRSALAAAPVPASDLCAPRAPADRRGDDAHHFGDRL